nr:uncharacterized protein LOC113735166 isoform X1 [Coffea arabica]
MVIFFLFFEQLDNVFAKCHRKEAVHSSSFPITATIYFEPNKHNPIANCKLQQMRGKNASVPALEYNPLTYMFVYMAANHYFAYELEKSYSTQELCHLLGTVIVKKAWVQSILGGSYYHRYGKY